MFEGKNALVLGVANKRSIAWAIAKRLADGGARLAFTFQGERIEKNVRELAETVSSPLVTELDVRDDAAIERVFGEVGEAFGGKLDILVHSVAFAAAEDLEGRFTDTPRDRFWMADRRQRLFARRDARAPRSRLMEAAGGGSILTMTYLGGERAVPHYNVMGVAKATLDSSVKYLAWDLGAKNIRVNAISAGPVRTLAARSIAGFPTMESIVEERCAAAPPRRRGGRRRRGCLPARGRGEERHRNDALRRLRVPRDGDVGLHAFGDERVDADGVDVHRQGLSLHQQLSLRFDGDAVVEAVPRVLVDQDRPVQDLRMRLESGSDVDRVAHARVGRAVERARVARRRPVLTRCRSRSGSAPCPAPPVPR